MDAPTNTRRTPESLDLGIEDLTQEIDAPLDERTYYRDETTLSRIDFEDVEVAFDI